MRTIEVLGPGCNNCKRVEANAREAIAMAGVEAEVVHVTDYRDIVAHGIMSTPGLIIDGQDPQLRAHPVGRRHRGLAHRGVGGDPLRLQPPVVRRLCLSGGTEIPVGQDSRDCPNRRGHQVDPEVGQVTADDGRANGASRVHRGASDRTANESTEGDGRTDRDRRRLTDRPRVGRHGHDDQHQEEGQHHLPDQRLDVAAGGLRHPERHVAERRPKERCSFV